MTLANLEKVWELTGLLTFWNGVRTTGRSSSIWSRSTKRKWKDLLGKTELLSTRQEQPIELRSTTSQSRIWQMLSMRWPNSWARPLLNHKCKLVHQMCQVTFNLWCNSDSVRVNWHKLRPNTPIRSMLTISYNFSCCQIWNQTHTWQWTISSHLSIIEWNEKRLKMCALVIIFSHFYCLSAK